jgi:phenylacetate-coenzyme A ligase PaaK-like adenylate-forming protein
MGDTGVVEKRPCGCGWEQLGLLDHLHTIRSFEKMTGEGMTIFASDLIRIVEEVLPNKFGGSTTDYQILEEEGENGLTQTAILISPEIKDLDEKAVLLTVAQELREHGKSTSSALSVDIWEKANALTIRREFPKRTPVGKVFSFQIVKANYNKKNSTN